MKKKIHDLKEAYNKKIGKPINAPVRIARSAKIMVLDSEEPRVIINDADEEHFELDEIINEDYAEDIDKEIDERSNMDDKSNDLSIQSEENDNEEFEEELDAKNSNDKHDKNSLDEDMSEEELTEMNF